MLLKDKFDSGFLYMTVTWNNFRTKATGSHAEADQNCRHGQLAGPLAISKTLSLLIKINR